MNSSVRYMQELPDEGLRVYTTPTRFRRADTPSKEIIYRRLYDGDLNVAMIGHEHSTPDKALINRVVPSRLYLHYVIGGKGTYNGTPIGAGVGFVSLPRQPHTLISSHDDPLHFYWIDFYGKRAESYVESLGLTPKQLFFPFDWADELCPMLDDLIYREQSHRNLTMLMEGCLLRCLACHTPLDQPKTAQNRMVSHVERAEQYIHRHMGTVTCAEVAHSLNLSRKYLNNLFVRFRGVSLQSFIMTVRMNQAADLLVGGEYISKEVAAIVGYADYAQFSKMFKKYHHLSPTEYIKARLP